PGPRESEIAKGWRSARVPDASDPERILILYARPRSLRRLAIESPPGSPGTPTDLELQADLGGTWTTVRGTPSPSGDRWNVEFEPVEARRLQLVLRGTRGGKAELSKLELD